MESCTDDLGLSIIFEKFEHKLSNYLKPCLTVVETEKQFHWDTICSFVRLHKNELYEEINSNIFCKCVIELLLEFDCPSKFFVSRIIDIYCICNCEPSFDRKSSRISKICPNQRLPFVLEFFNSTFPEHTSDSFYEQCREDYVYTLKGIKKGNMKFMRLLAKYGFTSISPLYYYPDVTHEYSVDTIAKFVCNTLIINFGSEIRLRLTNEYFRAADFLKTWGAMSWPPDCAVPKPSFDRMTLVLKGVDALLGQLLGEEEGSENLDCFRLYVDSTSYPFLTLPEFREFLIALSRFLLLEGFVNVDKMCDTFREMYPECDAFYQPRTLKHLCRCAVRRCYRKYGSLPVTIRELHVPTILRNYILCH